MDVPSLLHRPGFTAKEPGAPPGGHVTSELVSRLVILRAKDPALFLERYGGLLTEGELSEFEPCGGQEEGGGYEVRWHLARLRRSDEEKRQARDERLGRKLRCMSAFLA